MCPVENNLATRGAKRGEGKFWRYFLAFRPIVIRMTFRAARLGAIETLGVAGLTDCNSRQQDIFCVRAGNSLWVAAYAGEAAVSVVIESCVRHPSRHSV
jgi:hypothetical protein